MSIHQLNIYGQDKVEVAIERFKTFEPPEGYYVAFSGGKDSSVILALAKMAGVKFDSHYTLTSVDPPELVQFIKKEHPEVIIDLPKYPDDYKNPKLAGKQITMWNLIPEKKMPPTRIVRYCCAELKESRGEGRFIVTGVRHAESVKRSKRGGLELAKRKSHRMDNYDPDNPNQEMIHNCMKWARRHLNPIIDWSNEEVWEFIREYNVPYCCLYDEGQTRIGCVGCPMATVESRKKQFARWPAYKRAYIRAFDKMIEARRDDASNSDGINQPWKNGDNGMELYDYWIEEGHPKKKIGGRESEWDEKSTGEEVAEWWIRLVTTPKGVAINSISSAGVCGKDYVKGKPEKDRSLLLPKGKGECYE